MFKKLIVIGLLSLISCFAQTGVKISGYPRATTLGSSDLLISSYYNGSAYTTNKAITYANFSAQLMGITNTTQQKVWVKNSGGDSFVADFIDFVPGTGLFIQDNETTGVQLTIGMSGTAVTPGVYGDATHVGVFTVNQQGQITAASNTAISGGTSVYLNGASVSNPNFLDSSTAIWGVSAVTNITVNPTNIANAQISASAAIPVSKLDLSGRTLTSGAGLSGGGTLAADKTLLWAPNTFVNNLTIWDGSSATRTITYDLSGTDPVWTIGSSSVDLTTGTLKQGGTPVVVQTRTLTAGTGLSGGGDLSADRTFTVTTNTVQQPIWIRTGITNNGVFNNLTVWPGSNITLGVTNGTGNTNIDLVINSSASGVGGTGTTNELWFNILNYGGIGDNSTDNTAALNAAVADAVGGTKTNQAVSAVIYFPAGIYKFSGAPQAWSASSGDLSMIGIPEKAQTTLSAGTPYWSRLTFRGSDALGYTGGSSVNGLIPTSGTYFRITTTNQASFIQSAGNTNSGDLTYNWTTIAWKNIVVETATNSVLTVLQLRKFPCAEIYDSFFCKPSSSGGLANAPGVYTSGTTTPAGGNMAIEMPAVNCGDQNIIKNVGVEGYFQGISVAEHTVADMVGLIGCANGLILQSGSFDNHFGRLYTGLCTTGILGVASCKLNIDSWEIEYSAAGTWKQTVFDLADNNGTKGVLNWTKINNINTALNHNLNLLTGSIGLLFQEVDAGGSWTINQSSANLATRGIYGQSFGTTAADYFLLGASGTYASPTAASSGRYLGIFGFGGYDGTTRPGIATAYIAGIATANFTAGNGPTKLQFAVGSSGSAPALMEIHPTTGLQVPVTITTPGTTGNQTINKQSGRVNIAASGTAITVTSSFCVANSVVVATAAGNDATAQVKNVVPGAGSFTINMSSAVTAETPVNWIIINGF